VSVHIDATAMRANSRAEGVWYIRHAEALERWPLLPEAWARAVEARRLEELSPSRRNEVYLHGVR
jgi:hypothetical protein